MASELGARVVPRALSLHVLLSLPTPWGPLAWGGTGLTILPQPQPGVLPAHTFHVVPWLKGVQVASCFLPAPV